MSGTDILHLAAHGSYDSANPLYSAIALAAGGDQDGLWRRTKSSACRWPATSLVVLSACATNVGQLSRGDEVVGLTRAFFFAGAPAVIASLWNVNDEATQALMISLIGIGCRTA